MEKQIVPFALGIVCLPFALGVLPAECFAKYGYSDNNIKGDEKRTQKPNIIFIFSDDLSYKDLSSYGQKEYFTPNLDRLALNGIRFTQAYSGSPESAPSRASLITGMHMGHCRIRANNSVRGQDHLYTEDITIAEVLKQAGYSTGFIGKWGIGLPATEGTPDKQGFDFAYGYYDQGRAHGFFPHYLMRNGKAEPMPGNYGFNMKRVYKHTADTTGEFDNIYEKNGRLKPDGVKDPSKAQYSEDLFEREALNFVRDNRDKPFFLYYATQLPHGPLIATDIGQFKDKPWDAKHMEWASMVTRMDKSVGSIFSILEQLDLVDNTIIFFAGDNGYSHWGYFNRPRFEDDPVFRNKGPWPRGKFSCTHEGGMRVPLFVYWKGIIKPGESDHVCALYDILATAAEIAGVSPPETDGISLLPALKGKIEEQQKHKYLYWENGTFTSHAQSARVRQWWAFRENPSEPVELYDIEQDVSCKNNMADDHPDIIAEVISVFNKAHADSEWYVNPGESKESIDAKRRVAESRGEIQKSVSPNTQEW